jgi:chemotaxis protein MotB
MKILTSIFLLFTLMLVACVPQRKYGELELKEQKTAKQLEESRAENEELTSKYKSLVSENEKLRDKSIRLQSDLDELKNRWHQSELLNTELNRKYQKLLEANDADLSRLKSELQKLESELQEKEKKLVEKEATLMDREKNNRELRLRLEKLEKDLKLREKRVDELQSQIQAKDSSVRSMKEKISEALTGYEDKGIKVELRNGKVYVSMESRLLFRSGRTDVDEEGKKALLQLANALQKDQSFEIMIEGHTDSIPIKTARFADNWDLSVLRATSMLRILTEEGNIQPERVIPSGRGEFKPVATNKTEEGRAMNRRIDIIISPDLSEIFNLLEP